MEQYEFKPSFQEEVVALCYRDPGFLERHRDVLDPAFFAPPVMPTIMRLVLTHFDKHRCPPANLDMLVSDYGKQHSLGIDDLSLLQSFVFQISRVELKDIEDKSERIRKFGRTQAVKKALIESAEKVNGDFSTDGSGLDEIRIIMERAFSVGRGTSDDGYFVTEALDDLLELNAAFKEDGLIPTGYPILDSYVHGIGPGEIGFIMGPPGAGKTTWLLNLATNNWIANHKVAYFSFEVKDIRLLNRLASNVTRIPHTQLKSNYDEIRDEYVKTWGEVKEEIIPLDPKNFHIKYFKASSVGVEEIRSYLTYLKSVYDFKPDVIYIDYLDKLAPPRSFSQRREVKDYDSIGNNIEQMISLGVDLEAGVWTASQPNREGILQSRKGHPHVCEFEHCASAIKKAYDCDLFITLNQTRDEKRGGKQRAFIAKAREGEDSIIIDFDIIYSTARIAESLNQQSHGDVYGDDVRKDPNGPGGFFSADDFFGLGM